MRDSVLAVWYIGIAICHALILGVVLLGIGYVLSGRLGQPTETSIIVTVVLGGTVFGWFAILLPVLIGTQLVLDITFAVRAFSGKWTGVPISRQIGGWRSPLSKAVDESTLTRAAWQLGRFAFLPGWRVGVGVSLIGIAAALHILVPSIVLATAGVALVAWGVRVRWAVLPPVTDRRGASHPLG